MNLHCCNSSCAISNNRKLKNHPFPSDALHKWRVHKKQCFGVVCTAWELATGKL